MYNVIVWANQFFFDLDYSAEYLSNNHFDQISLTFKLMA